MSIAGLLWSVIVVVAVVVAVLSDSCSSPITDITILVPIEISPEHADEQQKYLEWKKVIISHPWNVFLRRISALSQCERERKMKQVRPPVLDHSPSLRASPKRSW